MVAVATSKHEAIAAQFEAIVHKRLANDKLVVPPMPVAAAKCLSILRDPDHSTKKLVAVLEQDPPLAARLVKLAASAAMSTGGGSVKTIEQAVTRVGAQRVRTMLLEASAQKVFESRDPRIASAFKATWEHSLAVAMLSRDLAAFAAKDADADCAYLCGLLHDVGKPVLGTLLLEAEKQLVRSAGQPWLDADAWIAAVNKGHRAIGVAVAEKWKLPEEVIQGIKEAGDYDSVNRDSLANYVRFGNALAKREGLYPGPVDIQDTNALIMIGRSLLSIDDDLISRVTTGLVERVQQRSE